ncbi:hypothetical protein [Deinococcus multiflagellatus]|uniref:Uncharacterized protein n=1 Tax=Deinococcus multiflagellatus TaxID=1656887 RepID=A0ABW1ZQU1_9DEIO|nr:hypothetical protein [Deinococcus multiflagellatus]MBZ9715290.1 hypothetical protein [Deinococcus multiflagellatus]
MGRKVLPGRFTDLAAFVLQCEALIRREGPGATVVIHWSGPAPRSGRREIAPGGLYARHLGPTPDQPGWRAYEVGAQAFVAAAAQHRLVEWRPRPKAPP